MAQTTVTNFFQSRKRTFDNSNIKKVNVVESCKVKTELVSTADLIQNKVISTEINTPKSTITLHQGLSPEEFNESVENNASFDASQLETPKSSQSVLTTKTPKRPGTKKRQGTQSVQRIPKRRKLCLTEPVKEEKSIKHFFNNISAKEDKSVSDIAGNTSVETKDKEEQKTDKESDSTMTKGISVFEKGLAGLTATPIKLSGKASNLEPQIFKKASFEDIKAQLKSCGKLQELKQCLFKINEASSNLKDIEAQKEKYLKSASPIKMSPAKSPSTFSLSALSKQLASPTKPAAAYERYQNLVMKVASPTKAAPAYERYHNLASEEASSSLSLPYKYKTLAEFFRCLDTIVCMLHNRHEICTFEKVKTSVQQMIKRMFDRTKLAQIKTVFPLAYFYSLENVSKIVSKNSTSKKSLVITPNLNFAEEFVKKKEVMKALDPSVMTHRRTIFHKRLLEITKRHHEVFLAGLNPPINVENNRIIRWHPKFPLDNVPDIEPSPLPEDAVDKVQTAQDVLDKMKSLGLNSSRVEKALESVAGQKSRKDAPEIALDFGPKEKTPVKKALGGVSQSLIDKIRAKEAAKIMQEMLRNPESERRLAMLNRLPDFASMLRSFFIQEKRAAIQMEVAVAKLFDSYRTSISQIEVQDHIMLLSEVVPDWLSVIPIRKGTFLKIDKKKDLGIVTDTINKAIQKEKGL